MLWRKHVGEGPVLKKDSSEEANAVLWLGWRQVRWGEVDRAGKHFVNKI